MSGVCVICGSPLKPGRRRYCGVICSQIGILGNVRKKYTECQICGRTLPEPSAERMCGECAEIANKRYVSKDANNKWELLLRAKENRERSELAQFREESRCFRCCWGRPISGNVVFCPAAKGTCFNPIRKKSKGE